MSRSSSCLNLAMRSLFASTAFAHRFRTPAMAPACAFCASLKTFRQCASRAVARRSSARSFRASASAAAAAESSPAKDIEERFEPPPPPSANDARNVDALLRRAFRAFRAFGASSRRVSSSAAPVSSVDAAANRVLRAGLPRAALVVGANAGLSAEGTGANDPGDALVGFQGEGDGDAFGFDGVPEGVVAVDRRALASRSGERGGVRTPSSAGAAPVPSVAFAASFRRVRSAPAAARFAARTTRWVSR